VPRECERLLLAVSEIFDSTRDDPNVGAQLPVFLIKSHQVLLPREISADAGGNQCEKEKNKESYLQRPFPWTFFLVDVVLMAFGLYICLFWSFRHIRWFPIGLGLMLVGWSGFVFSDVVLSFAENGASFLFCDASATIYRS
jgi:hypothetical protein